GNAGSSFSYFDGKKFTLIEARYTDINTYSIRKELELCEKEYIDTLHITSWDRDHCSPNELEQIIKKYTPKKIEYPGYIPHTDSGKASLAIIKAYKYRKDLFDPKLICIDPEYIESLDQHSGYGYNNIVYHPRRIEENHSNNNSTIKQFRTGSFNVLSLGDVECPNIAAGLRLMRTINSEVDIMILAHHGADNGFTTSSFLKAVAPSVAIVSSNHDNQFEHPKPEIRDLLYKHSIRLFTTKTGDVIIKSIKNHNGDYEVINLQSSSTEISSTVTFVAKKRKILSCNGDTIRNITSHKNHGP
ncbi:MAG TPA: hypothetical protein VKR58_12160, partial [Aquella sp.]|nr:hypothetical protein [Aquella sp.]